MNFQENIKNWKKFPNVNTLGYYHAIGNYIQLNEYEDENDFKKANDNPSLDKNRYSTYIHEKQHYIDQISTYWGATNIFKIYRAFNSVIFGKEKDFFHFRQLILTLQRDYFLEYYTEQYNSIQGSYLNPWKFRLTGGLRFDFEGKVNENKPIQFVSFSSQDNELISRVPLSVVSLLETTATYSEYKFLLDEANKLESPHKEAQIDVILKKLEKKLYHPELTLYSVAVHLISSILKIYNPIKGYEISSFFAKIALNIPDSLFKKVLIPSEFLEDETWRARSYKLIENYDRGFLFYILIKNFQSDIGNLPEGEIDINQVLSASNLPNEDKIERVISKDIQNRDVEILMERNSFNRQVTDKIFFGKKFRQSTGLGQQRASGDLSEFVREEPFLIFASTYFEYEELELKPIIDKVILQQDLSREEWFRVHTYCEKRIDNFNTICGI